jgi:hypothetical protein
MAHECLIIQISSFNREITHYWSQGLPSSQIHKVQSKNGRQHCGHPPTLMKGLRNSQPTAMANKKAGKAAKTAKLISFARRIWFNSSIALCPSKAML